ncbi:MAG: hypothetical protein JST52_03890 [Bacteroidetes bacterium]|nr:hypothetical protein [Bacteroidota bacterium]MBS1740453.1 hypothetical protein [Bacteroidota bacterium]
MTIGKVAWIIGFLIALVLWVVLIKHIILLSKCKDPKEKKKLLTQVVIDLLAATGWTISLFI